MCGEKRRRSLRQRSCWSAHHHHHPVNYYGSVAKSETYHQTSCKRIIAYCALSLSLDYVSSPIRFFPFRLFVFFPSPTFSQYKRASITSPRPCVAPPHLTDNTSLLVIRHCPNRASKVRRQQVTATHLQRTLKGKAQSTPHHCHASPIFWERERRVCVCVRARALYRSATTEERYSISWQPGESMQEPYTVQFWVCLILRPADAAVTAASDSRHYNCCNMIGSTSKSIKSDFQSPSSSCNSSGLEFDNVFQYHQIPTSKRSTYLHQTLQQERRY